MKSIANDIKGRGTGKVHFYGKFKGLNLDGAVMTDASMNFDILNTHFAVKDTIHLAPTGLTFNNIHISDMEGHSGRMNGYLHFQHFKNLNYRFEIQANNMLVMNTKRIDRYAFLWYGIWYRECIALWKRHTGARRKCGYDYKSKYYLYIY